MKSTGKKSWMLSACLMAGMWGALSAGCASSPAPNARIYDRYAEMLAAQNRAMQSPAAEPAAKPSRPADPRSVPAAKPAPSATADAMAPAEPSAKTPPVAVIAPKPAVEKPAPKPSPKPAPVPEMVPPVAPPSPSVPAKPVQTTTELLPEPSVPAPPPSVPAPVASAPAPVSAPSIPAPVEPSGPAPSPDSTGASSIDGAYTLKVGDGLQIYLRGIPSGEVIEDVIDEGGKITLPLINEITAAGITASDLERNIRKTYMDQDIYRNITVNVVVPTRFYFIQGEIRAPGRFQIMSATRLSQAIAGAGGYTEFASGKVVVKRAGKIFRTIRNARRLERVPEDDILLEPDDVIEVQRSLW